MFKHVDTDYACVAIALAVCLNMLSDTDVACVTIALVLCFIVPRSVSVTIEDHDTHQNLMTELVF